MALALIAALSPRDGGVGGGGLCYDCGKNGEREKKNVRNETVTMAWVDSESSPRPISEYGRNFIGLYPKTGSCHKPQSPSFCQNEVLSTA